MKQLASAKLDVTQSLMKYVQACLGGHVLVDLGDRGQLFHHRLGGLNVALQTRATIDDINMTGMIGGLPGSLIITANGDGGVATAVATRRRPTAGDPGPGSESIDLIHEFTPANFVAVPRIEDADELWVEFAHTFDGYLRCGDFEGCAELVATVTGGDASHDLAAQRAALFLSARADRFAEGLGDVTAEEVKLIHRIAALSGGIVRAEPFNQDDCVAHDSDRRTRWPQTEMPVVVPLGWPSDEGNLLYLVAHEYLGIRKIGKTTADRLADWRRRGWLLVDLLRFETATELDVVERRALSLLDQMGARSTPKMESLFSNLTRDGRHEMFDSATFTGSLSELLSDEAADKWRTHGAKVPLWISAPRSDAARKAHQHPGRDQKEAARKAVETRLRNAIPPSL